MVTERKRPEEAIQADKERYRDLVDTIPHGIEETDASGTILFANAAHHKQYGYAERELIGKSILDLIPTNPEREQLRDYLRYLVDEEPPPTTYFGQKITKSGKVIDVQVDWNYNRNSGQVVGFTSVITDITERKTAEEAVRRWADETSVMAQIGRTVSASLDINQVYESLGEEIRKLILFGRFGMVLVDSTSATMSPAWVVGTDVPGQRQGHDLPLAGSFSGEAVRMKSPVLLEADTEADLEHRFPLLVLAYNAGLRSFMAVPLIDRDTVIGVLQVQSKGRGIYTQQDLELLERIGNQISGAIANAQLYARQKQIEEALRESEEQTRASLAEKDVLLKEINHRVKNNLQIISSLLSLQSRDIQDEQALRPFLVSQDRIRAMALVHEKLYQSDDLARIDFGEYIKSLATELGSSYGLGSRDIDLKIDVENILLGVDIAIPCGVIVNELVTNSLKHAFPGDRSGEIAISFREFDGQYTMIFKDDGVGLPEDLDISRPSSLGLTIVNALTRQLDGTIDLGRNGGSEVSITFPAK